MRYIDYDKVDNPMLGDTYYDKKGSNFLIWDGNSWKEIMMNDNMIDRRTKLIEEFEQNPELFSDIMIELRKRKIEKLRK